MQFHCKVIIKIVLLFVLCSMFAVLLYQTNQQMENVLSECSGRYSFMNMLITFTNKLVLLMYDDLDDAIYVFIQLTGTTRAC